jgi:hypothetical protein
VIRGVNIVREPATFGSKSPDILIKKYRNHWGSKPIIERDEGYLRGADYNYWGELCLQ